MIDLGEPQGKSTCLDKKSTTKGQTQVTGYSIVQFSKDVETAKTIVADHPHLMMMPKAASKSSK